ncbi:hypothetical protein BCh11DRAFT_05946 [Burkholderia sp. Ch1-1]|uniref:Uncharacterized protein n=1 Tax=Paraburkholderia dioscoreae TaxID=2604047 RepID=A0A5Q4Z2B3_9BURK|nr:hypothetical protein BCh11DRAFT_05946 [Burkholderia sp. Ch1-1]VVD29450.1 conserved protein of unknown function [Paraburkholderia dioscoreae]
MLIARHGREAGGALEGRRPVNTMPVQAAAVKQSLCYSRWIGREDVRCHMQPVRCFRH